MGRRDPIDFDVLIAGAGYSGSLLALCLARSGLRVAVLDRSPLPRVVIGEGTTPEQNRLHGELAERCDLPELGPLASFGRLAASRIPVAAWPKEALYFVHDGEGSAPGREMLYQTSPWPNGPEYHVWRADLDLYLAQAAMRRGAKVWVCANIDRVDTSADDRVTVEASFPTGRRSVSARYLVDATGMGSGVTAQLCPESWGPETFPLCTRALCNHFSGVVDPEACYAEAWRNLPVPRGHATIHHVNEHGWAWVIPFANGVSSVGIVENLRHPDAAAAPSGEGPGPLFYDRLRRFPRLAEALAGATPLRPFLNTGPMQRRLERMAGARWLVTPPASGFADPLLSTGMASSTLLVARLVDKLDGLRSGDVRLDEHLAPEIERTEIEQSTLTQLLGALTTSMRDFDLFVETFRLSRQAAFLGSLGQYSERNVYGENFFGFHFPAFRQLVDEVSRAAADPATTAEGLHAIYREHDALGFIGEPIDAEALDGVFLTRLLPIVQWKLKHRVGPEVPWYRALWDTSRRITLNGLSNAALLRRGGSGAPRIAMRGLGIVFGVHRR